MSAIVITAIAPAYPGVKAYRCTACGRQILAKSDEARYWWSRHATAPDRCKLLGRRAQLVAVRS